MTLIVFKNADGEIRNINVLSKTIKNPEADLAYFNEKNEGKSSAEFVDAPEGSVLIWLYKKQQLRIMDFREELIDIQATLNDLYGRMDWIKECLEEVDGHETT